MEFLLSPLAIVGANLLAAMSYTTGKTLLRLARRECPLILQTWRVQPVSTRSHSPCIELRGRPAGLIGVLQSLLELRFDSSFSLHPHAICQSTRGLLRQSEQRILLSQALSVVAKNRRDFLWLLASGLSATFGVASGLSTSQEPTVLVLNTVAWLFVAGFYSFVFSRSRVFQILVFGPFRVGVSFRPRIAQGRKISFQEVLEVLDILANQISQNRSPATATSQRGTTSFVSPPGVPLSPYAPPPHQPHVGKQEAPNAPAPMTPPPSPLTHTGTVEYGDDQPLSESSPPGWSGAPEPGTSDSIQFRQSITRSATGMFLGVPSNYDDDEADYDPGSHAPPSGGNTHGGTVSWEEHGDKTQDEMRAEAELTELKQSRPTRGEAKLRLRELMRCFPQTEASAKARRMLERLEAGQESSTKSRFPSDTRVSAPLPTDTECGPPQPPLPIQRAQFGEEARQNKDPVDCTVFAPPNVPRNSSFLVQVFIHIPEESGTVAAIAQEFDEEAKPRGVTPLGTMIERGSKLTLELSMRGLHVDDPIQQIIWQGRSVSRQFEVLTADAKLGPAVGTLTVLQNSTPIGVIRFKVTVGGAKSVLLQSHATGEAQRYQLAYISYASQNRAEVIRRVQMLSAVGIKYFQDVLNLEPGEHWKETLFLKIDESDVFFLFWSQAAKESAWVQREWQYGLEKKGDSFIHPVIIEGPPIALPPPELAHLHFNDRLLVFLG